MTDYEKNDLLAAGALGTATAMIETQLNGLRSSMFSQMPAGGEAMSKLRSELDNTILAAIAARVDAEGRYAELLRRD